MGSLPRFASILLRRLVIVMTCARPGCSSCSHMPATTFEIPLPLLYISRKVPDFGIGPRRGHHAGFSLIVELEISQFPRGIIELDLGGLKLLIGGFLEQG